MEEQAQWLIISQHVIESRSELMCSQFVDDETLRNVYFWSVVFINEQCTTETVYCVHCFCGFKHNLRHLAVLPPAQGCVPGVNKPSFLTPTPLHGDVHHAAVGQAHKITLQAQIADNRSE